MIEEIYDQRHAMEISDLEKEISTGQISRRDNKKSMPLFLYEYFMKKTNRREESDQSAWDFVFNIETMQTSQQSPEYKKDQKSVEVFAKFLDESFDTEDLLFFLNARFVVYNELEKRPVPVPDQRLSQRSILLPQNLIDYLAQIILSTTPTAVMEILLPMVMDSLDREYVELKLFRILYISYFL